MNGERPSSPVHEVEASRPGTETRVRPRTDSEKTLPPSAPAPGKRRALLLVEGADDEDRRSYDAVLTEADLEGELRTLQKADSPEPPPTSSLSERENLTGQLLDGRYQIDYVLGIGSMGVVYGARHAAVGKLVAVKALRAHLASDAEALQRFNAEATAATSIGNQHIVETFDFGRLADGTAYLVMEYLEGRPLADLIEGWAPLPLPRITKIGVQIAEALNAAHLAGIVHRDLKPDNVFLCEREGDPDFVKILDFGIAKFGVSQARLTQAGAVFGTPAYMSPEQAAGKTTDGRTDVYALGVMLYEMACGRAPFHGESALAVLSMHSTEEPEALSLRQPDVSKELEAIVHKCLRKDPDARYASMAELAADLSRLAAGMPVRAEPAPPSSPVASREDLVTLPDADAGAVPPPVSVKGGGGVPFPLVLLLLLGVAGGMFWMLRHRAPTVVTKVTQAEPKPLPPPLPSAAEVDEGAPETEVALVLFPLDARVLLGDKDLGPMPVSVKVKDGQPVKLRIVRDGYWTRKLTVDGSKKRVVVGLVKRDASKANPEAEGDDEPSGALPRSVPTAR
ncbi:MAG: serine/threonine protein kinase [Polyangiaceae bacterium]|nr:serine/threonine protein kinase [Polyangiaceae bacterium]